MTVRDEAEHRTAAGETQTSHTDESKKCERTCPVMFYCGMAVNVRSESHW